MWRRQIHSQGEWVTIRRNSPSGPTEARVRARVLGYQPEELIGGITQGDRKVYILAEDLENSGFPLPLKIGGSDVLVVRERAMSIRVVDDSTHRLGGELIAYEIRAAG